jgi:arylsulfatase A-like enzyme
VESQVRTIDLAPTILDLFGLPKPREFQGVSLLPWIHGERDEPLVALSYGYPTDRGSKCIRTGKWKYICRPDGQDELYQLVDDPEERRNLIAEEPERVKELKVLFFDLESHPNLGDEEVEDELIRHMLEGLGYL